MKEITIKSKNEEQLNAVRLFFNKEISCYRITEVKIISYESTTPLDVFVNRLTYLPISGTSQNKEFALKTTGIITGIVFNQVISPFYLPEDVVILNEGVVNITFSIGQDKATSHSCFLTIDSQYWCPEEGIFKITPNIDYTEDIDILNEIEQLRNRYREVEILI